MVFFCDQRFRHHDECTSFTKTHPKCYKREFMIHRLVRIIPLYFFTSAVFLTINGAAYFSAPFNRWIFDILSHIFFIHNLFSKTAGSLNGPTWSLGLEMQFYILLLLLTPIITRKNILTVFFTLILSTWLYRYSIINWIPACNLTINRLMHCSAQLPGFLDQFAWGILLAVFVDQSHSFLGRLLRASWTNSVGWIVLFLYLFELGQYFFWPRSAFWHDQYMVIFWRTLMGAAFACLLAAAIAIPDSSRIITYIFRPFNYLGKISYGIYLWHMIVLTVIRNHTGWFGFKLLWMTLLATLVLSALTWHFLEKTYEAVINQYVR